MKIQRFKDSKIKKIMRKRYKIIVSGKVQGVFFRAGAKDMADSFGLTGHARNLPSGEVEIMVEGEDSALEKFVDWLYVGPERAKVEDVVVESQEIGGGLNGFGVK